MPSSHHQLTIIFQKYERILFEYEIVLSIIQGELFRIVN